jgi:Regulator of chromosome condensation (RCC1) repeat
MPSSTLSAVARVCGGLELEVRRAAGDRVIELEDEGSGVVARSRGKDDGAGSPRTEEGVDAVACDRPVGGAGVGAKVAGGNGGAGAAIPGGIEAGKWAAAGRGGGSRRPSSASGTVSCWGADNTGQLGSGPLTCTGGNGGSCSEVPIPVPGLTNVTALTAGDSFACALLSNGTVDCWGDNVNGELGNGTTMPSFAPVPVPGLTGVTAMSAAGYHICVLIDDGSIACWGEGSYGELGAPAPQKCATNCSMTPIKFRL